MNRYPLWKNLFVFGVVAFATLLALPNIFGDDEAVLGPEHEAPLVAPAERAHHFAAADQKRSRTEGRGAARVFR